MPIRLSLPFNEWPPSDKAAWLNTTATEDWLPDNPTPVGRWSDRHREVARLDLGRYLEWLRQRGRINADDPTASRLQREDIVQFIRHEQRRLAPRTLATVVRNLLGVFETFAPHQDWAWLRKISTQAHRRGDSAPRMPPQIADPRRILDFSMHLMESDDLETFVDGLMIAMLVSAPIRMQNFSTLQIGMHLRRSESGWYISLSHQETKTAQDEIWPLPPWLDRYIEFYLECVRPRLLSKSKGRSTETEALWIGRSGQPIGDQVIRPRINERTEAALGFRLRPHTFRHCAVSSFVLDAPSCAAEAPAILGHRSARTTEKHYILGQRIRAAEEYHRILRRRTHEAAKGRADEEVLNDATVSVDDEDD